MTDHIMISLSADPPGLATEFEDWTREQAQKIVRLPGFISAQTFRRHEDHDFAFPETRLTRPPYRNLSVFEIDEAVVREMVSRNNDDARPPQPPGGMGPHRSDGYLFVAVSPTYRP